MNWHTWHQKGVAGGEETRGKISKGLSADGRRSADASPIFLCASIGLYTGIFVHRIYQYTPRIFGSPKEKIIQILRSNKIHI